MEQMAVEVGRPFWGTVRKLVNTARLRDHAVSLRGGCGILSRKFIIRAEPLVLLAFQRTFAEIRERMRCRSLTLMSPRRSWPRIREAARKNEVALSAGFGLLRRRFHATAHPDEIKAMLELLRLWEVEFTILADREED